MAGEEVGAGRLGGGLLAWLSTAQAQEQEEEKASSAVSFSFF